MKDATGTTGFRLELDGGSLTVGDVVKIARGAGGAGCALSPVSVGKIEVSNRLKHELIQKRLPIYGVTTGFGDSANRQISPDRAASGCSPAAPPEIPELRWYCGSEISEQRRSSK